MGENHFLLYCEREEVKGKAEEGVNVGERALTGSRPNLLLGIAFLAFLLFGAP